MSRIAFGYYGGKHSHLAFLLPLLPQTQTYVEPFGGSAAVLLNRAPSPVEVYNDLYSEVVTFFRVLRNDPESLIAALKWTPHSREEFIESLSPGEDLPDLERARRFYVRARQSFYGMAQLATEGNWAYDRGASTRKDGGKVVSRWRNGIPKLWSVAERLLRVQIEHLPALELLDRYDSPETLFYCDPPYPKERRSWHGDGYRHEMSDADHEQLSQRLHRLSGKAAISGYRCALMDRLYGDWACTLARPRQVNTGTRCVRQEAVWTNYPPVQGTLFGADPEQRIEEEA